MGIGEVTLQRQLVVPDGMALAHQTHEAVVKQQLTAQLVRRIVDPERQVERVGLESSEDRIGEGKYLQRDMRRELRHARHEAGKHHAGGVVVVHPQDLRRALRGEVQRAARRAGHVDAVAVALDHPRALPLYQRIGFTAYAREERFVELP